MTIERIPENHPLNPFLGPADCAVIRQESEDGEEITVVAPVTGAASGQICRIRQSDEGFPADVSVDAKDAARLWPIIRSFADHGTLETPVGESQADKLRALIVEIDERTTGGARNDALAYAQIQWTIRIGKTLGIELDTGNDS